MHFGEFSCQRAELETSAEQIVTLRLCVDPAAEWDAFAQRCSASFRCSHRGVKSWQFKYLLLKQIRRFDVLLSNDGVERKIGQFAVGAGSRHRVFSDGLQLLPEFERHWTLAIVAILQHLGSGFYTYGSDWSIEPPRDALLSQIPGVTITQVQPTYVQTIDFTQWKTWQDYQKCLSTNVRRNVHKATRAYKRLEIKQETGPASWRHFFQSMQIRQGLFRRKGIARFMPVMVIRSIARLLAMNQFSTIAYLIGDGTLHSFYSGIIYGSNFYYLEGASTPDNNGASWYLLMNRIQQAYHQSGGKGKFIMGSDDGTQAGTESWEGLCRSRRQCCATPFSTSVVRFEYAGINTAKK